MDKQKVFGQGVEWEFLLQTWDTQSQCAGSSKFSSLSIGLPIDIYKVQQLEAQVIPLYFEIIIEEQNG